MKGKFVLDRPRIILFGDSLTQRGFDAGGWASSLAHHYSRRVDIVNRGLGGYNTRWALKTLPQVLQHANGNNTLLMTIFFGANDSVLKKKQYTEASRQHVPLEEYRANLRKIAEAAQEKGIKRLVFLTPPAVHEPGLQQWEKQVLGEGAARAQGLSRSNNVTRQYKEACEQVAQELGFPSVDLWGVAQAGEGWGERHLCDGLHFTPVGQQLAFKALLDTIQRAYPELAPEGIPPQFPLWDKINAKDLDASFAPR